ncbi:SDR family oxidoreductase [Oryzicola mucosus]|uniref:SDR family oxidoreductase n=1 Tax=Oryzicola mucosus TaxID=2767425 RepID=A0A8J6PLZ5_9HYPH|nr:SDR family oxidoreductase [Oryzicola mucosus]MBD0417019.1 SDR family oxidoreductase [Oryzicola mucosus]
MDLTGKVAIVTGASSGIGWEIAKAYAAVSAKTVLAARTAARLDELASEIERAGGSALAVACDVTDEEQVEALFARCREGFGEPDILVNNAGIADHTPTVDMTLARWEEVMRINITSVFLCSRAALKAMIPRRKGRIINIGSISAKVPRPHTAGYTASKFALEGLTRSLALDGREHGIAVSMLHPGSTQSMLVPGVTDKPRPNSMNPSDVARVALVMATLPDDVNLFETTILPVAMPFLGRG